MKYRTIVIDPPWSIAPNTVKNNGVHELPYNTMTIPQIKEFPIHDYAADNCTLFMWAVYGKLPEALEIVKHWDFRYYTILNWHKPGGICHSGFFRNAEPIIVAYRGKFSISYDRPMIPSVFEAPRGKHSEKPAKFYELLRQKTPEPRIDIFGRRRHVGFDIYGDQAEAIEPMTLEAYNHEV